MAARDATLSRGTRERRKPTEVSHQLSRMHSQNRDRVARPTPKIARGVAVSAPYLRPQYAAMANVTCAQECPANAPIKLAAACQLNFFAVASSLFSSTIWLTLPFGKKNSARLELI